MVALGERGMVEPVVLLGYYRILASMLQVFAGPTPVGELTATLPGCRGRIPCDSTGPQQRAWCWSALCRPFGATMYSPRQPATPGAGA